MTNPWVHGRICGCASCMTAEATRLRKRVEELEASLSRIASLCADGVVTLGQVEHIARAALKGKEATP